MEESNSLTSPLSETMTLVLMTLDVYWASALLYRIMSGLQTLW
jgi:hypothetical protein